MPIKEACYRFTPWVRTNEDALRAFITHIKEIKEVPLGPWGDSGRVYVHLERVNTYNQPNEPINLLPYRRPTYRVIESSGRLKAIVIRGRGKGEIVRTLDEDGETAFVWDRENFTTVTLFEYGGSFDTGEEPGRFSKTVIVP